MKNRLLFMLIMMFLITTLEVFSQFSVNEDRSSAFYFDAICFKNTDDKADSLHGRVDIFILIPYQTLNFEKSSDLFISNYEVMIEVFDTNKSKVLSEKISKKITEKDYFVSQGGNASYDKISKSIGLPNGKYEFQITIIDLFSRNTYKKSREINIINFDNYSISLSGILLISSIEERNNKYIITPHVSDNIGSLTNGFFVFFEIYNDLMENTSIDCAYELQEYENGKVIQKEKFKVSADKSINREYKRIKLPENLNKGIYRLKIIALRKTDSASYSEDDYLAITERIVKNSRIISGYQTDDIETAIRYLRYVANQSDMEYIESSANTSEKQKRFEEFWKNLDPTPSTERNEAYDDYYSRIDYANKNLKSYNEGWLTDMGMVYVIYGAPTYVDQSAQYNTRGNYIKWTYLSNREFLFVDETGLGDYRLAKNYPIMEKYKYK